MSSEDLVRALDKPRPEQLTAPPDGQTLEQVIGELQSVWGVPQYPQEYRITIKVAEEPQRAERAAPIEEAPGAVDEDVTPDLGVAGQPKREKAPAAPRVRGSVPGDGRPSREQAPRRRRRARRRRRGGGGQGPAPPSST